MFDQTEFHVSKYLFCLRNNIDVLSMLIDNRESFLYDLINTYLIHLKVSLFMTTKR